MQVIIVFSHLGFMFLINYLGKLCPVMAACNNSVMIKKDRQA